ncbi:MAG: DUF523 domain-containing protein [Duodenibacillus sp.]
MTIRLLMSSCLVGQCCRWDANNGKSIVTPRLHKMLCAGEVAVICPECAGGLDVPRPAAEIAPGDCAKCVLSGTGRVVNTAGEDVTAAYVKGAEAAVTLAKKHRIRVAVLKARSPSCSPAKGVYDGTFTHTLVSGSGVAAQALANAGVMLFDETELDAALAALD